MTSVHGVPELAAALDAIVARTTASAEIIVRRGQAVVEANIKKQFTGAHAKGTPTTSAPGSPPDVVTGTLRRSVTSETPVLNGAVATGRVYPTAVYARIQELGGRGLPPRPYMEPAHQASLAAIQRIALEEWARATRT